MKFVLGDFRESVLYLDLKTHILCHLRTLLILYGYLHSKQKFRNPILKSESSPNGSSGGVRPSQVQGCSIWRVNF